jgi:hypothetical protein
VRLDEFRSRPCDSGLGSLEFRKRSTHRLRLTCVWDQTRLAHPAFRASVDTRARTSRIAPLEHPAEKLTLMLPRRDERGLEREPPGREHPSLLPEPFRILAELRLIAAMKAHAEATVAEMLTSDPFL